MIEQISRLLPGANCSKCGFKRCELFAEALVLKKTSLSVCSLLEQERFRENAEQIQALLSDEKLSDSKESTYTGLIDNYRAEYVLDPLEGEPACRETLVSFAHIPVRKGDTIRYRPLGCPIMHIAEVISSELGMITVHIKGPRRQGIPYDKVINMGVCMVIGFTGVLKGRGFEIGDTIRFIPGHCMMQKVHSGVVVQSEDRKVDIELIDLKVWELPAKTSSIDFRADTA